MAKLRIQNLLVCVYRTLVSLCCSL